MTIRDRIITEMANRGVRNTGEPNSKTLTFVGMGNGKTVTIEIDDDAFGADAYVDEAVRKICAEMVEKG